MARLAVHPWPAALPAPQDGVIVISSAGLAGASRAQARARIRLAVQQVLAQVSGLQLADITLDTAPGQAPRALINANGVISEAGLSISHDDGVSLAAINLHGAVGVDLMRVALFPDWHRVAQEYLGPLVAGSLAACAPERRALAFARAWTEREASLKCLGLPLGEWAPAARCRCIELAVPSGLYATLALMTK